MNKRFVFISLSFLWISWASAQSIDYGKYKEKDYVGQCVIYAREMTTGTKEGAETKDAVSLGEDGGALSIYDKWEYCSDDARKECHGRGEDPKENSLIILDKWNDGVGKYGHVGIVRGFESKGDDIYELKVYESNWNGDGRVTIDVNYLYDKKNKNVQRAYGNGYGATKYPMRGFVYTESSKCGRHLEDRRSSAGLLGDATLVSRCDAGKIKNARIAYAESQDEEASIAHDFKYMRHRLFSVKFTDTGTGGTLNEERVLSWPFSDVEYNHAHGRSAIIAYDKKILVGDHAPVGQPRPARLGDEMTRLEAIALIFRAYRQSGFLISPSAISFEASPSQSFGCGNLQGAQAQKECHDIKDDGMRNNFLYAREKGIITLDELQGKMSREQFMTVLSRFYNFVRWGQLDDPAWVLPRKIDEKEYSDWVDVGAEVRVRLQKLAGRGVSIGYPVKGKEGVKEIEPKRIVTRGEVLDLTLDTFGFLGEKK